MPSIKATLSDTEYDLLTSIAGDNFKEDQNVPASALWLENRHLKPVDDVKRWQFLPQCSVSEKPISLVLISQLLF